MSGICRPINVRWQLPPDFNIAEACCGRWARATPKATAIYFDSESGCRAQYSIGSFASVGYCMAFYTTSS